MSKIPLMAIPPHTGLCIVPGSVDQSVESSMPTCCPPAEWPATNTLAGSPFEFPYVAPQPANRGAALSGDFRNQHCGQSA